MTGRVGGEYAGKCPSKAPGGPLEEKPLSSVAPSQPLTVPVGGNNFYDLSSDPFLLLPSG